jgi:hypothetical protein
MKYLITAKCNYFPDDDYTEELDTLEEAKEFEAAWMEDIPGDFCTGHHTFEMVEKPEE